MAVPNCHVRRDAARKRAKYAKSQVKIALDSATDLGYALPDDQGEATLKSRIVSIANHRFTINDDDITIQEAQWERAVTIIPESFAPLFRKRLQEISKGLSSIKAEEMELLDEKERVEYLLGLTAKRAERRLVWRPCRVCGKKTTDLYNDEIPQCVKHDAVVQLKETRDDLANMAYRLLMSDDES